MASLPRGKTNTTVSAALRGADSYALEESESRQSREREEMDVATRFVAACPAICGSPYHLQKQISSLITTHAVGLLADVVQGRTGPLVILVTIAGPIAGNEPPRSGVI